MSNCACPRLLLSRSASVALMLVCLAGRAAQSEPAPSGELASVREQLVLVRQTLERLDERLQQLERAGTAPTGAKRPGPPTPAPAVAPSSAPLTALAPATVPAPTAALGAHEQAVLQEQVRTVDALTAWRAVRAGMRQDEVRQLLGEPQSTLVVGNRTGWIYTYRNAGKGSVFFSQDGVVVSLIGPGQGALHLY